MNAIGAAVVGVLFIAIYGLIGAIAVGRPLFARLAFREAIRRPLQSAVVVGGLMIGTGAILGPQVWGDSVADSLAAAAYRSWGRVDLTVSAGGAYFDPEVAARIAADPAVQEQTSGVQAGLESAAAVVDLDRDQAKPNVRLVGFDPSTQAPFGAFVLSDGTKTYGTDLDAGEALVSSSLAGAIQAGAGDHVKVMVGDRSVTLQVAGVTRAEGPGAYGLRPAIFVPVSTAQRLLDTHMINVVRITARGDGQTEIDAARDAAPAVRAAAAAASSGTALDVREDKAMEADAFQQLNEVNRPVLIALSLFVVTVGVALVINVALALAEERRPRMALLRALGLTRAGLVGLSLIEGAMYSLAAALAGILPAALVGWAMFGYAAAAEQSAINGRDVVFALSVRPTTVATALAAGALITVAILFFAAIRTSRLAIASAIRRLPEPPQPHRRSWLRRSSIAGLAVAGVAGLLAGNLALRLVGGVALIALASVLARGRVPDRGRVTVAGLATAAWSLGMLVAVSTTTTGTDTENTTIALEAISIGTATSVFGLAFALAANLRLLESLAEIPGGLAAGVRVSLRPALAYLTRRPMRAGLATGAFALVVAMQALLTLLGNAADAPDYGATAYSVVVTSISSLPNPIHPAVDRQLTIPTRYYFGPVQPRTSRFEALASDWREMNLPLYELSDSLLREPFSQLELGGTRAPDQQELWSKLRKDPTAVVASVGTPGGYITLIGNGVPVTRKVVANFPFGFMNGVAGSAEALLPFAALPVATTVLVRTATGADPARVAGEIRRSYVSAGVDATTTRELLDTGRSQGRAFLLFFRLLMGMGMVVAVVSLGILALRAVVERGRAIGILRALGYQPRQVLGGMLGESSISASLGVVVGLAVGWIAWHIFVQGLHQSAPPLPEEAVLLLAIYLGVLAVTVAVTAGPALQASRLTPIEALRTVD